jgi:hypothetical protein
MHNVINIVYYISLFLMFYEIFIIVRYVLQTTEKFRKEQLNLKETTGNDVEKEALDSTRKPEFDTIFVRKHGKLVIIALIISLVTIFINGFAL